MRSMNGHEQSHRLGLATHAPLGTHLHPWLLVEMRNVELPARRMRQALVMLLENLVEALHASHTWYVAF